MTDVHRIALAGHEEHPHAEHDMGSGLATDLQQDNKLNKLSGFLAKLIEAHRYVHNRRSAANWH